MSKVRMRAHAKRFAYLECEFWVCQRYPYVKGDSAKMNLLEQIHFCSSSIKGENDCIIQTMKRAETRREEG